MATPLPPTPTYTSGEDIVEQKIKDVVTVRTTDLIQGNANLNVERAKNTARTAVRYGIQRDDRGKPLGYTPLYEEDIPRDAQGNLDYRAAFTKIGDDLKNPAVRKDSAWLGALNKVTTAISYLGIPMELLLEVPEGVLPGKWWGEGTAERQDFEAWRALFGGDSGNLVDRLSGAAAATEKRPLMMQLGMGALEMVATGGASAIIRGASKGTSIMARAAASGLGRKVITGASRVIDPTQGLIDASTSTYKYTKNAWQNKNYRALGEAEGFKDLQTGFWVRDANDLAHLRHAKNQMPRRSGEWEGEGLSPIQDAWNKIHAKYDAEGWSTPLEMLGQGNALNLEGLIKVFSKTNKLLYSLDSEATESVYNIKRNQIPRELEDTPLGTALPITLVRGNEFQRLFQDLWAEYKNPNILSAEVEEGLRAELKTAGLSEEEITKAVKAHTGGRQLEALAELTALHLQYSMAHRPGAIERLTLKNLVDFARSEQGVLDVGTMKGERSGLIRAIDEGQAKGLVEEYLRHIDPKTTKMSDLAFGAFGARRKSTAWINSIVKKYRRLPTDPEGTPFKYDITPNARLIRNQKASERWLVGEEVDDLMAVLAHADDNVTAGYVNEMDRFIRDSGEISVAQEIAPDLARLRLGEHLNDAIVRMPEAARTAMQDNLETAEEAWNTARKAGDTQTYKGKSPGAAPRARAVIALGDAMLMGEEAVSFASVRNKDLVIKYKLDLVDDRPVELAQMIIALQGLRTMATNMGIGFRNLDWQRRGILNQQKRRTYSGKIKKAGMKIRSKGGTRYVELDKDFIETNLVSKRDYIGRREQFADDYGIGLNADGTYWNDEEWLRWGTYQLNEGDKIKKLLDENAYLPAWDSTNNQFKILSGDASEGSAIYERTDFLKHEALAEYIDHKTIDLWFDFKNLEITDPELYQKIAPDIGPIIDDLRRYGTGGSNMAAMSNQKYWVLKGQAKKAFLDRNLSTVNILRADAGPLISDTSPVVGFMEATIDEKLTRVNQWVGNPAISGGLKANRINTSSGTKKIRKSLYGMLKVNPQIFGENFAKDEDMIVIKWKGKEKKQVDKWTLTPKGHAYIEDIVSILYDNRTVLFDSITNYKALSESREFFTAYGLAGAQMPLRPAGKAFSGKFEFFDTKYPDGKSMGTDLQFHGLGPQALANIGSYLTATDNVSRIGGWKWAQKLAEYDNFPSRLLMGTIRPIVALTMGGSAAVAAEPTKIFSSIASLYRFYERESVTVARHIQRIGEDALGLTTAAPSDVLMKAGIREGNQWFEKFYQKLKSAEDIEKFESQQHIIDIYKDHTGSLPALRKIRGITKDRKLEGWDINDPLAKAPLDADFDDPMRLLTQVDVVLERILPQHWHNYFDGLEIAGRPSDELNALRYIKQFQDSVDARAVERGVDIRGMIQSSGGKYLRNYLPRLFRRSKDRVRLGTSSPKSKLLNSYNSHFESRAVDDILDHIAPEVGGLIADPSVLQRAVMEPLDTRLGLYTEVMWKEGANAEATKWLGDHYSDLNYYKSLNVYKMKVLQAMTKVLNSRIGGREIIDPDSLETLKHGLNQETADKFGETFHKEYSWLWEVSTASSDKIKDVKIQKEIQDWIGLEMKKLTGEFEHVDQYVSTEGWLNKMLKQMPKEDQFAVRAYLEPTADNIVTKALLGGAEYVYDATQFIRAMRASFDFGAPLIHGYNSATKLPWMLGGKYNDSRGAWGKATNVMKQTFLDPDFLDEYMLRNAQLRHETSRWVMLGETEPLGSLGANDGLMQTVKAAAEKLPYAGKYKVATRFERSFIAYTDALRMHLWQGLEPSSTRKMAQSPEFKGVSEKQIRELSGLTPLQRKIAMKEYHDLGASINKSTGVYDQDLAQMTPAQRIFESSILFFAPMYRRATFGVIADLAKGGVRRREAMRQITGVIGAGAMMSYLAELTGNNDRAFLFDEEGELDITARFGKFNVGEHQVGVGTAWWTLFRIAGDISMHWAGQEDDRMIGEEFKENFWVDKVLTRRGRSQLAPMGSIMADMWMGRTFNGDPLRDEGDWHFGQIALHAGRQTLPFWLDTELASGDHGQAFAMGAEMIGLQGYQISEYDKQVKARDMAVFQWDDHNFRNWRQEMLETGQKISWDTLPDTLKTLAENDYPELRSAKSSYEEKYQPALGGMSAKWRDYKAQENQITLKAATTLAEAQLRFARGDISGRELNTMIRSAFALRRQGREALLNSGDFEAVKRWYYDLGHQRLADRQRRKEEGKPHLQYVGDMLWDVYVTEVLQHPDNFDGEGFNWENYNKQLKWFTGGGPGGDPSNPSPAASPDEMAYLDERSRQWFNAMPLIGEFEEAKDNLEPYWKIHETIFHPGSEDYFWAKNLYQQPSTQRDIWIQADSRMATIDKKVRAARLQMRKDDPNIDWLLVKWYDLSPQTTYADSLQTMLVNERIVERQKPAQMQFTNLARGSLLRISPAGDIEVAKTGWEYPLEAIPTVEKKRLERWAAQTGQVGEDEQLSGSQIEEASVLSTDPTHASRWFPS